MNVPLIIAHLIFSHCSFFYPSFLKYTLFFQGVRRLGSAAADMSHVGLGITEGYWEYRLKPWDMAAGVLVIFFYPMGMSTINNWNQI